MNKLLILFVVMATPALWAANDVEITVTTKTNLKVTATHRVQVKGEKIFFDSEQIDPVQLPLASLALAKLARTEKDVSAGCASGTYIQTVKKNNKTSKSQGCLDSARAAELLQSIQEFQRLNVLKK